MTVLAVSLLVVLAVFLVLFVTLIGRRRLAQRTTAVVPPPPAAPVGADAAGPVRFGPSQAVYVSSTLHGDWLARIGAHGLGDRSNAVVSVHDGGVLIEREGGDDLWLPVGELSGAGLAPGMAGKYVGADGLVVLTWTVPADDDVPAARVDSGLRMRLAADRGGLVDAVRHLLAAQQTQHAQQYPEQQPAQLPEQNPQHDQHQQEAP